MIGGGGALTSKGPRCLGGNHLVLQQAGKETDLKQPRWECSRKLGESLLEATLTAHLANGPSLHSLRKQRNKQHIFFLKWFGSVSIDSINLL